MTREIHYDEVFDAQQHFRLILDSMARPGKINTMPDMELEPPASLNRASAMVAMALLNTDVSFSARSGDEVSAYIGMNTGATEADVETADFIFISGLEDAAIAFDVKVGTLPYPENSATMIVDIDMISKQPVDDALAVKLKGPGIETEATVYLQGINPELLLAVREQNFEFPLGIDLIITDNDNHLLCIPRSNQFELIELAEAEKLKLNNH